MADWDIHEMSSVEETFLIDKYYLLRLSWKKEKKRKKKKHNETSALQSLESLHYTITQMNQVIMQNKITQQNNVEIKEKSKWSKEKYAND